MKKMLAFALCTFMLAGCSNAREDMSRMGQDTRRAFDDVTDDVREGVNDVERNIKDDYDDMTDNDDLTPKADRTSTGNVYVNASLSNVPSYRTATMGHSSHMR